MHDLHVMEGFETADDLDEHAPDFILRKRALVFLVLHYLLVEITIVGEFHYDAKGVIVLVDEDFLIGDNIGILDARQDAYFVDSVRPLFLRQEIEAHLLEGIVFAIGLPFHMVNTRVGTRS